MTSTAALQYRWDVQGLRGISILLVLLFHLNERVVSAGFFGVDVFFVVSGFIITSLLLKEQDATGHIRLLAFWARRAKRLLPNATLVLIFVLMVGAFSLPGFKFDPLASDVVSAAVYVSNFHFADLRLNYFTSNRAPSPVVHYWSLSVEEQFYVVWPLVLIAINALRGGRDFRSVVGPVLALIWIASFAYCCYVVQYNQPLAFFHTGARVWELATGALLAVHSERVAQLIRPYRETAALAGLVAILLAALLLSDHIAHPGPWTLIPTLGTVLVIAAGTNVERASQSRTTRLLSAPPMRWLGDRSYSLYLWHWPVFVFARDLWPDRWWTMTVALLVAVALAELAFRFVENPLRHTRWLAGRIAPQLVAAGALVAGVLGASVAAARIPNALAGRQSADWSERLKVVREDVGTNNQVGCHLDGPYVNQPDCLYGRPDAARTAVLFGDSHAAQWFAAVEKAAWLANWKFHAWTKSLCPSAMIRGWDPRQRVPYKECDEWRDQMLKRILSSKQRMVVFLTSSNDYSGYSIAADGQVLSGPPAQVDYERGLRETTEILLKGGHHVVIIRDTPVATVNYMDCIVANRGGDGCGRPRDRALHGNLMEKRVADAFPQVVYIDVADQLCGPEICPVVINNQVVYRDDSHMSATFAATLYKPFLEALERFSR